MDNAALTALTALVAVHFAAVGATVDTAATFVTPTHIAFFSTEFTGTALTGSPVAVADYYPETGAFHVH